MDAVAVANWIIESPLAGSGSLADCEVKGVAGCAVAKAVAHGMEELSVRVVCED